MRYCFFDTETTGLPIDAAASDPRHPHILEVYIALLSETFLVVDSYHGISRPFGWKVPDDMSALHGITTEFARAYGVPESENIEKILEFGRRADLVVGSNISFDIFMTRIGVRRFSLVPYVREDHDPTGLKAKQFCLQRAMTSVCKLPKTRWGGSGDYKWPKLEESYRHCAGKPMEHGHGAKRDVEAGITVFRWMAERGLVPTIQKEQVA